jgi:UDP-2,3-diacylglucosamine pyrophosphatase LpxH
MRRLADDTLIVFLSDSHIGGDPGRDIFESPDELAGLLDDIHAHPGPVELVLAGDFFDFLRIGELAGGGNRAAATIARPEYRELFDGLRRFAAGEARTVVYLPGNHDAEVWWNPEIRATLEREGLVHEFALSYSACFDSDLDRVVYCEHGNQFDPANTFRDYADPLDTPLGDHVVTDLMPRLPGGRTLTPTLHLREVDRVFPLAKIPEWIAGRLFYDLVTQAVRWLVLPLIVAYAGYWLIKYALGGVEGGLLDVIVDLGYELGVLLVVFGVFVLILRGMANQAIRGTATRLGGDDADRDPAVDKIRRRLERDLPPPLDPDRLGEIAVFVSGHTHDPWLREFDTADGGGGAAVNSGCWLRQAHPVEARLGVPSVFVSHFVLTHARVHRGAEAIEVELWELPRPCRQDLLAVERLAVTGRLPAEPEPGAPPRILARATVGRAAGIDLSASSEPPGAVRVPDDP